MASLPVLRQRALSLTRHKADAEDLMQTAIASALAAEASFEPGTNFRAWMTRILRNRFFSNLRSRRETVELEHAPAGALSRSGGQEESLAMQELARCVAVLPREQRRILLMITVDGLSYTEASEQLGVAVGTLKCRVFRARRQLRMALLGQDEPAAPGKPEALHPMASARPARARPALAVAG
ncbi:sigma-70 family RNA polymerase sigma factor [Sediminicoccus sp. KRV36]|uniref:sigma-70 family RNA polymerase sigma factor n=1 Tax=Sediminicoccus sp. KRV36 TaxID=3133721 RepID=UPI00200BF89E|nr:sigma-70 family RNA polymerase sigma factor [Sediminicoccus rosea]